MSTIQTLKPTKSAPQASLLLPHCPHCNSPVSESLRDCPTCGENIGCPNVRAASTESEKLALHERTEQAHQSAMEKKIGSGFTRFRENITQNSHVVVAMPPLYARSFLSNTNSLYANYESLVGTARIPASNDDDRDRFAVGGKLFGSYASKIRYGALSLDGRSLANYGMVFFQLRDVTVQSRTSFLHENSYLFLDELQLAVRGAIPPGYRSDWENRDKLASAKVEALLTKDSCEQDWESHLLRNGHSRADDKCIEAHIFGSFNADAVHSVKFSDSDKTRQDKLDIDLILEYFKKKAGGTT